jgi:SAM-dependent methyltransferase
MRWIILTCLLTGCATTMPVTTRLSEIEAEFSRRLDEIAKTQRSHTTVLEQIQDAVDSNPEPEPEPIVIVAPAPQDLPTLVVNKTKFPCAHCERFKEEAPEYGFTVREVTDKNPKGINPYIRWKVADGTYKGTYGWDGQETVDLIMSTLDDDDLAGDPGRMPSDPHSIRTAMDMLNMNSSSVFADVGCGDGRVLIEAIRRGARRAVGVEIDPDAADEARRNIIAAGLERRIVVVTGDAKDFSPAAYGITHGYAYLFPTTLETLRPVLMEIPVVVTPSHEIPGMQWSAKRGEVYAYRRRLPASQTVIPQPATVRRSVQYGGRTYTGRVCSNRRCAMCNRIQALLNGA